MCVRRSPVIKRPQQFAESRWSLARCVLAAAHCGGLLAALVLWYRWGWAGELDNGASVRWHVPSFDDTVLLVTTYVTWAGICYGAYAIFGAWQTQVALKRTSVTRQAVSIGGRRRVAGYAAGLAAVVIGALWVGPAIHAVRWDWYAGSTKRYTLVLASHALVVLRQCAPTGVGTHWLEMKQDLGFLGGPMSFHFVWNQPYKTPSSAMVVRYTLVSCPLWVPLGMACAITWWCLVQPRLRALRQAAGALCRRCGYNLTSNVTGRCPECGELIRRGAGQEEGGKVK